MGAHCAFPSSGNLTRSSAFQLMHHQSGASNGASSQTARTDLATPSFVRLEDNQRQRLASSSEKLQLTGHRIENVRRTAQEAESTGADILRALHAQRASIEGIQQKTETTEAKLQQANKTLGKLERRCALQ